MAQRALRKQPGIQRLLWGDPGHRVLDTLTDSCFTTSVLKKRGPATGGGWLMGNGPQTQGRGGGQAGGSRAGTDLPDPIQLSPRSPEDTDPEVRDPARGLTHSRRPRLLLPSELYRLPCCLSLSPRANQTCQFATSTPCFLLHGRKPRLGPLRCNSTLNITKEVSSLATSRGNEILKIIPCIS